ncbi:uridine kinase [Kribbella voronezhensis]|uniref:Uridine kinase n=1 Tax=Kribbella voronezhensis TaxID=2512212 RepID=A0A4R7TJM3_9ACTN|nr:(d)CMP kinase [Kribbella voronezhensis]TDU91906.1 uridine kinase [Kribbella voronezhensis]
MESTDRLTSEPVANTPLTFDSLLDHVQAAPARLGRTRLISVDGPAGSGKSTLAGRIAARAEARDLHTLVVHMDDLYDGWDGAVRGFGLLRDHVLKRLADGREGRYRRYDWNLGAYAELHIVPATLDLLIVEGVTAADRDADPWQSLRVWIETSNEVRLDRGIARDGEALRDRWLDWMRWERDHFAAENTRARANVVVDGSPETPHDPELELIAKVINLPHDSAAS